MKLRISRTHAVVVAFAIAALPLSAINAAAQIAVSSNDGKVVLNNVPRIPSTTPSPLLISAFLRRRSLPSSRRLPASPDRRKTSLLLRTNPSRWSLPR